MAIKGWNPGAFFQTGDPTTVNETTPFAPGQIGTVVPHSNTVLYDPGDLPRIYQYVYRDTTDGITLASAGSPAHLFSITAFAVTADASESLDATGNLCIGTFPGTTLAAGKYGFIQVGGNGPALLKASETTTAAAGITFTSTSTDLEFDTLATAQVTAKPPTCGTCLSAKDAGSIGTNIVKALIHPTTRIGW